MLGLSGFNPIASQEASVFALQMLQKKGTLKYNKPIFAKNPRWVHCNWSITQKLHNFFLTALPHFHSTQPPSQHSTESETWAHSSHTVQGRRLPWWGFSNATQVIISPETVFLPFLLSQSYNLFLIINPFVRWENYFQSKQNKSNWC